MRSNPQNGGWRYKKWQETNLFRLSCWLCSPWHCPAAEKQNRQQIRRPATQTGRPLLSHASDFAGEITALTAKARQSEENFEFDLAVARWEQIRQKIVAQLGQDSWQARNAGYALESARAKSQFSAEQRQQLQHLRQINDQVKQSFQDKQFSQALGQSVQMYNLQAQLTGKE